MPTITEPNGIEIPIPSRLPLPEFAAEGAVSVSGKRGEPLKTYEMRNSANRAVTSNTAEMLRALKNGETPEDGVIRLARETAKRDNAGDAENAELKRQLAIHQDDANTRMAALLSMGTTDVRGLAAEPRAGDQVTPGDLMSRSVQSARGITTTGTGKAFSPEQTAKQFVDLLAPQSVVMASGVNRVQTNAETYSFPVSVPTSRPDSSVSLTTCRPADSVPTRLRSRRRRLPPLTCWPMNLCRMAAPRS